MIHKKEEVSKRYTEWHQYFDNSELSPSDIPPSTRTHLLTHPKWLHQLYTEKSNLRDFGGHCYPDHHRTLLSMAGWCLRLQLPFETHVFPHLPPQHACGECCGEACRLCLHGGLYHWSLADDHNWWERWQKCILRVTAKVPVQTLALTTCWRLLTTNYSRQAPFLQLYPLPSSHTGMLSLLWAPRNCSHSHRDMSQPVLLTYHCSYACLLFDLSRVKPGTISLLTACLQISYLATRCKFVQ